MFQCFPCVSVAEMIFLGSYPTIVANYTPDVASEIRVRQALVFHAHGLLQLGVEMAAMPKTAVEVDTQRTRDEEQRHA